MADNNIIIYSPTGEAEKHTRANARDIVNSGRGYTWARGVKTTPAGYAPFATLAPPEGPAPSQKVLDSVGGSASAALSAAAGAAVAQAAEQQRMAIALAEQAAQAAAAAAVVDAPPVAVMDFTQVAVDSSDLDADVDADAADAEDAAAETEVSAAPRRGRPRKA